MKCPYCESQLFGSSSRSHRFICDTLMSISKPNETAKQGLTCRLIVKALERQAAELNELRAWKKRAIESRTTKVAY